MKKSVVILLLFAFLLCGCEAREKEQTTQQPRPSAAQTQPPETEVPETEVPETEAPETAVPAETTAAPTVQNQAEYSILENDHSIRNENGDILVNIRYDQVILNTAEERWQPINDEIRADYQAFLEELKYLKETTPQQWEEQMQSMGYVYGNLLVNRSARVTQNSGGIFSICMTQEWFLGGVFSCDYYGLNFDLNTGAALTLAQLSDLPEEEFARQLKQIVCDELAEDVDVLFQDPAVVLEPYALEDFDFYLDEGELVLTFPTYTFGPGALGPAVIRTGIVPQI